MVGRRSLVKRSSRSSSPKKRRYSTSMELYSHRLSPSCGQNQEQATSPHGQQAQIESDSDANWDCPDTPTPMTNSQKRSAYLPLGTPVPYPDSKRPSTSKPKSGPPTLTPATTLTTPTPKLEFFKSFDEQLSYDSRDFDINHPQMYSREEEKLRDSYIQNKCRKMRRGAEARAGLVERTILMPQTGYASSTNDDMMIQRPEQEHGVYPRMHLAPLQHVVETPLRRPVPGATADTQRQVSISEVSHFSGGTVSSKRSVFSTPGRDELERKMALIHDDDGPFANAVSMADLDERRRVVSEQRAGDDRRAAILEVESSQKKKKNRACKLGVGCNVM